MSEMTSAERLAAALQGKATDHIPFSPNLAYVWETTFPKEVQWRGQLAFLQDIGADPLWRGAPCPAEPVLPDQVELRTFRSNKRMRKEVETPVGVRQFRLPDFELAYRAAPMRIACAFGEPRRALWVGEFHRQLLTVSAFPVFDESRERAESMFPETLPATRMRTVDLQSGTAQVTGPQGRLIEVPKAVGEKGRTLAATRPNALSASPSSAAPTPANHLY